MDNPLFGIDIKKEDITIELNAGSRGLQGPTGPIGEKGDPGDDLRILNSYETEEELKTEHPVGFVGDAYLVNMNLYIWSNQEKDWVNTGNIQGPEGPVGQEGPEGPIGPKGDKPVKGVDYFTDEEVNEILQEAKDYTDAEIANFDFIKIVQELPEIGLVNRTYFVPKTSDNNNDLYDEYMWINESWEFVGTKQIEVDLTDYYKKEEVDKKLEDLSIADYDSLPVGSIVDYEGEEIPDGYEEVDGDTKILWTNPSPSSSFEKQTVILNSDNYDVLEIFFDNLKGNNQLASSKITKGNGGAITSFYRDGTVLDTANRTITYIDDTSYEISSGIISQTGGTAIFSNNNQCIPLYIIGYKTGLFS